TGCCVRGAASWSSSTWPHRRGRGCGRGSSWWRPSVARRTAGVTRPATPRPHWIARHCGSSSWCGSTPPARGVFGSRTWRPCSVALTDDVPADRPEGELAVAEYANVGVVLGREFRPERLAPFVDDDQQALRATRHWPRTDGAG